MFNRSRFVAVVLSLSAAALLAACAVDMDPIAQRKLLGDPVPVSAATRILVIPPQTRYVNVTGGEIVAFVVGDKSFAWSFDGAMDIPPFDLATVAPPGVLDHPVIAYVAPNPWYTGDGRHGHGGGHR